MLFRDRRDAGSRVGQRVAGMLYALDRSLVLGLPRGGVPVAYEVARAIAAPLDVFLVRKLGVPGHEELAMGAIASGGVRIINDDVTRYLRIPEAVVERVAVEETRELHRRERLYRGERPYPDVTSRTVIVVDDGLATGASMRAALEGLRQLRPRHLIAAVPIAPEETRIALERLADDVVCAATAEPFMGVGRWYEDFRQVTDDDVRALLEAAGHERPPRASQRIEELSQG